MAPMRDPRWAVAPTGALMVAGCAASADDTALASAPVSTAADRAVALSFAPDLPIKDPQLHALAAMSGPYAEDGTMGSGCEVVAGEPLDDGAWFGYVLASAPTSLTLDIACVYGPQTEQYTAFAQAEDSATHPYVVVNDVVTERSVRVAPSTAVYVADLNWAPSAPSDAKDALDPEAVHGHVGVWVVVEDGDVAAIVEPAAEVPVAQ